MSEPPGRIGDYAWKHYDAIEVEEHARLVAAYREELLKPFEEIVGEYERLGTKRLRACAVDLRNVIAKMREP